MHPEISLILLLVLSGIGQGIFIILALIDMILSASSGMSDATIYAGTIASLAFISTGMAASIFHLGNPQRGWKAIIKWNRSWLSREAVSIGLFAGSAFLYLTVHYLGMSVSLKILFGLAGIVSAFLLYISSSMLYAKIRFIREWSNIYTVLNFIVFGITGGGAVLYAIVNILQPDFPYISMLNSVLIALGLLSLILKLFAYRFNETFYMPLTLKHALFINDRNIKLMSTGTSYDNYNTIEYSYPLSERQIIMQQTVVIVFAFVIPILLWLAASKGVFATALSVVAAISMTAGLLLERRLFFVQGNHIQNLYYSNFRRNKGTNPLLSKAKKGTPVPL
ncbi:MAG: dimethyl sulfoxide reductase anchor subunit [Thermodesulfovibrionales bacterium]|nr:dimethyl sulfoxide reductase anchor subunit [Thermodesulfovibrionales bacterium]